MTQPSASSGLNVELTERDWDHVLLALENACESLAKSAARASECGIPNAGTKRATERYADIAANVAAQLGFGQLPSSDSGALK